MLHGHGLVLEAGRGLKIKPNSLRGAEGRAEGHAGVRSRPCWPDWPREPGGRGPAGASVSPLDPTAAPCGDGALGCLGWLNKTVPGKEPEVAWGKDLVRGDSTVPVPASCRESGEAGERQWGEFSAFMTLIQEWPGGPTGPCVQAAAGTCCVVLDNAPDLWVCFEPGKKFKKAQLKGSAPAFFSSSQITQLQAIGSQ